MLILHENDLESIAKVIPDDPKVHCLIGKGIGNQYYSVCDSLYTGLWTQEIYEVDNGFKDAKGILIQHVDAEYARRQQDYQWKVGTYEQIMIAPGNVIGLRPNKEPPETLSIAEYTIDAKGKKTISLGAKRPKFLDSWDVIQNFSGGYTDEYIKSSRDSISQTANFTPPETADLTFTVPSDALVTTNLPRVTLALEISVANGTSWLLGATYAIDDRVTNDGSDYVCIAGHVATAALEPGDGTGDWEEAWKSDPVLIGRVATRIMKGDAYVRFGQFPPGTIDGIGYPEIDITDDVVKGENIFKVGVVAETGSLPLMVANATMNFYKRTEVV